MAKNTRVGIPVFWVPKRKKDVRLGSLRLIAKQEPGQIAEFSGRNATKKWSVKNEILFAGA